MRIRHVTIIVLLGTRQHSDVDGAMQFPTIWVPMRPARAECKMHSKIHPHLK